MKNKQKNVNYLLASSGDLRQEDVRKVVKNKKLAGQEIYFPD